MSTICEEIHAALSRFSSCEETEDGARIPTHCLYPSFTHVYVYIAKVGKGYRVHDGSGAYDAAWLHGRDAEMIVGLLKNECANFHLDLSDTSIVAPVPSTEWLAAAIMSVANASALAARNAIDAMRQAARAEI